MADTTATATKDTASLQKQIQGQVVSLGLWEKAQVKVHKTMVNTPIVKQIMQMKRFVGGIMGAHKAQGQQTKGQKEGNKQGQDGLSTFQALWVKMTAYGLAAKFAAKGTSTLGKAFMSLIGSVLFIFGILMLLVLGLGLVAATLGDVNSPLAQWLSDFPLLGDILTGFKIILTGEDGESGLAGAVSVFKVAMLAAGVALVLFGAPVAIVVGTLVMMVGIFQWVKGQTDSVFLAIMAAATVAFVGLWVLLTWVGGVVASFFASFMLPFALITAGIGLFWAALTGKIHWGWGIIGAILIAIGVWLLAGVLGFATIAFMPVLVVVAIVLAVVGLVWLFWDEIVWAVTWIWNGLMKWGGIILGGIIAAVGWLLGFVWALVSTLLKIAVAIIMIPINIVVAIFKFFVSIPGKIKALMLKIGLAIMSPMIKIGRKIMAGIRWVLGIPGRIVRGIKKGIKSISDAVKNFWNDKIAAIVPRIGIPDWVPIVGGMDFGPFPPYMAKGGVVSGPKSGYSATLHGTEAVVPLPDGRSIPVSMEGGASGNTFNIYVDASGIAILDRAQKDKFAKEIGISVREAIERDNPFKRFGSPI